ncbi:hypothetical protein ABZX92_37685 [Lentzea sp. NPDC006480]|uniref:hypothetical protein n=1 Tax=Lentzea sp. NPDC006480 TaxID=3157176 RepID=UPI0033A43252
MAFDARVFQILIASPGDVEAERDIITEVIHEWNYLNSSEKSIVLLPLRYETHSSPELNERRQGRINREVVDHCDMAVGVFWTRLGTPTGDAESGTAEEIQRVSDAGKPVMLYFSREPIAPDELDPQELHRLQEFRKTFPSGQVEDYATTAEFRDQFARHLALKVRELVARDTGDENRDTDLPQHTGLELRLAEGDPLTPLSAEALIEVDQIVCVDIDDIPDYQPNLARFQVGDVVNAYVVPETDETIRFAAPGAPGPDYHRVLVGLHLEQNTHRAFRLALVNTEMDGVEHLHLDIVVTSSTSDNQFVRAESPRPALAPVPGTRPDTVVQAHTISVLNLYEPPRDQFVVLKQEGPGSALMELDVPVVHAGRTMFSRNEFWLKVTKPSVVTLDATAYSSKSAPFAMQTTLEVKVNRREMTWREIVAEYQTD